MASSGQRRSRGVGARHDRVAFVRSCVRGPTNAHPVPFFARFFIDYRTHEPGLPYCENHVKTITSVQLG